MARWHALFSTFLDPGAGITWALSVGLVGNCAEVLPELVRRGVKIDAVTDQTSAHDPLNGYVPAGLSLEEAEAQTLAYIRRFVPL